MKKFILSISVVVLFVAYAFYGKSANQVPVAPVSGGQGGEGAGGASAGSGAVSASPLFKDGEYTGPLVDVYYGKLQVKAVISGGKLTDVVFPDYPKDKQHSLDISNRVMPVLKTEAIAAQSANVDGVSGATEVWAGFQESLGAALSAARI